MCQVQVQTAKYCPVINGLTHLGMLWSALTIVFKLLMDEKQQIYKLTARHRVPRCELVYLLFLKEIVKMFASRWIFWPDSMNVF